MNKLKPRIIPGFLIRNNDLINQVNFNYKTQRYIGDPINTLRIFNQFNCDEICILDICKQSKKINFNLLQKISEEIFLPLSYGGKVESCETASKIIYLGFEKIIFHSLIFLNFDEITEFSKNFGIQSTVLNLIIEKKEDEYFLYDNSKASLTDIKLDEFIKKINLSDIGEIIITVKNLDGSFLGPDLKLIKWMREKIKNNLIYCGGISCANDFNLCFQSGANAVISNNFFIMKKKQGGIVLQNPKKIILEKIL